MKGKKIVSTLLALLLLASLPVSALAAEWDISNGDITVNAGSGGQTVTQGGGAAVEDSAPVITGSSQDNTLTINAEKDQTASVTLSGANIDVSGAGKAAVSTTGEGNVSIELNGDSTLKSGEDHAGLEKNNGGSLTIQDEDKNGKLTAEGGDLGAGIGGGDGGNGSGITISGGEVTAIGGEFGAGIGGGSKGNGNNIAITGGEVTAIGGEFGGAGIGGGSAGDGSDITISGGEVKAIGGGAGIGGGDGGNGNNITISGGEVTAIGGEFGAGIGGGYEGNGNNIAISGGKIKATGGRSGAGIGGGKQGSGSDITISGGVVTAIGGYNGAGIGGGAAGIGNNIAISGGEVKAIGGVSGAGIGGSWWGKGKDITVSGAAKLKVQGGVEDDYGGVGAGIGGGGSYADGSQIPGAEVEPDTSGLLTTGWIEYYAPGADMEKDKPTSTTFGTSSQPEKPIEPAVPEQPEAERGMDAPLYRVTDRDGRDIAYTAEQKGGVLTVTVDADFAILTGRLSGVRTLKAQGVEKLVFVTKGATSAFLLSDLLGKGESGEAYWLTHDGKAVTFTLGESMADVSAILTKP